MTDARAFRGCRFPAEVILGAVRWSLQFGISYRDLELMLADRGIAADHTTLYRWVQRFAPELEEQVERRRRCEFIRFLDAAGAAVLAAGRFIHESPTTT